MTTRVSRWKLLALFIVFLISGTVSSTGCDDDGGGGDGDADGDGDGDSDGDGDVDTNPVPLDPSDYTFLLEGSPASLPIWTTPATHRLRSNERPPEETRPGLFMAAARREFEPLQLMIGPASGTVTIAVEPFAELGAEQQLELYQVGFRGGLTETLTAIESGNELSLDGEVPTVVWLVLRVPEGAPAGETSTTVRITHGGSEAVEIPLTLRVFDFSIPESFNFSTQINIDISSLTGGGSVDDAKDVLFDLRMTPKNPAWPSGFNWQITWENERSSDRCEVFWDEPDESPEYSIGHLARRYILGEGWNGIGFPTAMIFQFVDNSTPRPSSFCGVDRGDHYGSSAYNAEWSQYLGALDEYLVDNGMEERAYYYVQNEPQNAEDERLAAHLCRLTRAAAPNLRIAISEEPKPSIAEDPDGACGYDIWIAHIRAYEEGYAWQRQDEHGEEVWLYSLPQDPPPYFNPTREDSEGMDMRIIPWVSWHQRATGWAYYDGSIFFNGPRPNVRGALMREGFEDYEYLYLANGGARPRVFVSEAVDATVDSVASGLTSWNHDPDALMALRFELGRFIEGSVDTLPVLEADSDLRPRGEYFINFQDPTGAPTADPLVVDGRTYLKIGWSEYDEEAGFGWFGEQVANPGVALYGYDDVGGFDEIQRSYVYDDWGRDNLFEFALENGRYEVTIGVGRPARGYPGDPHNALVEGQVVVDDEVTTDAEPQIERTVTVDLTDGSLSVIVGGRSASTGDFAYTFLAYIEIVPVD